MEGTINELKKERNMSKKEISLIGQTFKTLREHYKMSSKVFNKNIEKIRPELDEIVGRKLYYSLVPAQVELIIKHLEGGK